MAGFGWAAFGEARWGVVRQGMDNLPSNCYAARIDHEVANFCQLPANHRLPHRATISPKVNSKEKPTKLTWHWPLVVDGQRALWAEI